jgi:hypothetical protein
MVARQKEGREAVYQRHPFVQVQTALIQELTPVEETNLE